MRSAGAPTSPMMNRPSWAEADARDAIDFALSAIVEAEYATLDAMLARKNAAQLAASSS